MTYRRTSLLLAATLIAASMNAITAAPASACTAMEGASLLTFHVEVAKTKVTYRIGEVVKMRLTVTRPAKEDPLGQGTPMDRPYFEPVEGAVIGIGTEVGDVYLSGTGTTSSDGTAEVKIKIENFATPGEWANTDVYARKTVVSSPCATIEEYGHSQVDRQFRTTDPRPR